MSQQTLFKHMHRDKFLSLCRDKKLVSETTFCLCRAEEVLGRPYGEPALCALKNAARDAMPDVEMIPKESSVGYHAANGEAENVVKEVKRQVRVLKSGLEEKLRMHIPADHQIHTRLPRHGANCLSRYRVGDDGKTAEQRRKANMW